MATVTSADPFNGLPAMGAGSTSYFDTVVFKSSDPLAISTMVSMNLNVSGVVDSTSSGGASAILTMFVQSFTGDLHLSSNNGSITLCSINFGASSCNSAGGVPFSLGLALTTLPVQVALDTPIVFGFQLDLSATASNSRSASVDFAKALCSRSERTCSICPMA